MIAVNLNSVIINSARTLLTQDAAGWQMYEDKQPIEACTCLLQRRGWAAAQRGEMAAADAATAAYLAKGGKS